MLRMSLARCCSSEVSESRPALTPILFRAFSKVSKKTERSLVSQRKNSDRNAPDELGTLLLVGIVGEQAGVDPHPVQGVFEGVQENGKIFGLPEEEFHPNSTQRTCDILCLAGWPAR